MFLEMVIIKLSLSNTKKNSCQNTIFTERRMCNNVAFGNYDSIFCLVLRLELRFNSKNSLENEKRFCFLWKIIRDFFV